MRIRFVLQLILCYNSFDFSSASAGASSAFIELNSCASESGRKTC